MLGTPSKNLPKAAPNRSKTLSQTPQTTLQTSCFVFLPPTSNHPKYNQRPCLKKKKKKLLFFGHQPQPLATMPSNKTSLNSAKSIGFEYFESVSASTSHSSSTAWFMPTHGPSEVQMLFLSTCFKTKALCMLVFISLAIYRKLPVSGPLKRNHFLFSRRLNMIHSSCCDRSVFKSDTLTYHGWRSSTSIPSMIHRLPQVMNHNFHRFWSPGLLSWSAYSLLMIPLNPQCQYLIKQRPPEKTTSQVFSCKPCKCCTLLASASICSRIMSIHSDSSAAAKKTPKSRAPKAICWGLPFAKLPSTPVKRVFKLHYSLVEWLARLAKEAQDLKLCQSVIFPADHIMFSTRWVSQLTASKQTGCIIDKPGILWNWYLEYVLRFCL